MSQFDLLLILTFGMLFLVSLSVACHTTGRSRGYRESKKLIDTYINEYESAIQKYKDAIPQYQEALSSCEQIIQTLNETVEVMKQGDAARDEIIAAKTEHIRLLELRPS